MNNSQQMLEALEQQDLSRADSFFQKALEEDSDEVLLELSAYLEGIGFYPQAAQIYEKLAPKFPEVYINLAAIAGEDGLIEEAFDYLEKIGPESEWYVSALALKADLYAQLDNRVIYDQTGISTYQRIGLAYARLGKFESAIEFLEKALELEYDDQTAFELASLYFDQEDYQKAVLYFKQLDTISPDFEGYEYGYSQALHKEHQTEEALKIAQQGLSKNPFETRLLLLASQLSYELHQPEQAEAYLIQAQENADDQEEILLRLATIYQEQERYEDILALAVYEPENLLTKWMIARSYQETEELDAAYDLYKELATELKDNPEFLEQFSYLLRELGKLEEAKDYIQSYLQLVPDDLQMQDLYDYLS